MWLKWLPWKLIVGQVARSHGFIDPMRVLAHLHRFAQPSEVAEPVELLRAGAAFHARGLINSRVIQHNLDWIWPYWVERQFDPTDPSFVPRAFSITHINLTHRNWTAVGLPDCEALPIVDPRGLITPLHDRWSIDAWVLCDDGRALLPSRTLESAQRLDLNSGFAVETTTTMAGVRLLTRAEVLDAADGPTCRLSVQGTSDEPAWLVLCLRPYNPEGISFIHDVTLDRDGTVWKVDGHDEVELNVAAERHHVSRYKEGDVALRLLDLEDERSIVCDVGMATTAAMYRIGAGESREVMASVRLGSANEPQYETRGWPQSLHGSCALEVPDVHVRQLWDAALRTLILHSPGDIFAGPYTYKRFWFRDAAFVLNGLLCAGILDRCDRIIDRFFDRQSALGYFHSQEGEWDANGQVLWIIERYCALSGNRPPTSWRDGIYRGARWIARKRLADKPLSPHAGLLPAGFSAEHLGPNDYYYWDDFWGVAGLRAASQLAELYGDNREADDFRVEQAAFNDAIERSLDGVARRLGKAVIPASPHRRMDAGAIGSLATSYPLTLCDPSDPRLLATTEFLLENCFVKGAFFQDMVHSGMNAYLTMHVAQVLLRAGDARHFDLIRSVAQLASPTGQWPEAVHPATGGGCMGDGQHAWAASEWVAAIRNCFVREEGDRLLLGSGIPKSWLQDGEPLSLGPAPTRFGDVTLRIATRDLGETLDVNWQVDWHAGPCKVDVCIAGYESRTEPGDDHSG